MRRHWLKLEGMAAERCRGRFERETTVIRAAFAGMALSARLAHLVWTGSVQAQ